MQGRFQYSILYYQPSQLVEERFAIALLFFFPDEQEISFLAPSSLNKLKHFLKDSDIAFLRKNLKRFDSRAKKITHSWNDWFKPALVVSFEDVINFDFLVPDSSSLFFSKPKSGIVPKSAQQLKDYYFQLYFKRYIGKEESDRITEPAIKGRFSNLIKEKIAVPEKFIRPDVEVEGRFFTEKFSYGWQNGAFHLVTPVSFDLSDEDYIKRKSQQWIGVLSNVEEEAKVKDYNFDILVARPRDRSLFAAYDSALAILDKYSNLTRVYEQEQIEDYVDEIKKSAKSLPPQSNNE